MTETTKTPAARQTKAQMIRGMLSRKEGATLAALCKATGWQTHSARAAISSLRKAGFVIERAQPATGRDARYKITASPETAS
ncbi:DUF3489 domain-containing protein [Histidinibacterium aquaticum]|uniref:DUF3489 domain-containing protein n=1 Tax=Histidinibacterium aquaticum TaxID=2613962 RepID=A0A5J5GK98_9RHOB|nr:DUF3489 domain-containing protein [Histidinibacterium aquaticum]KAA9008746.1 DUF3489 domain-containing protein [Histidinibacterium aquaticum]